MTNVITSYLSETTGEKVTNADLMNSIRNLASDSYKTAIPELSKFDKINHANVPYQTIENFQNEFFNILVNRIGSVVVKALSFSNPLGIFKSETFEQGQALEEIYVHLADAEDFDAKDGTSPFKFSDTKIELMFHDINREKVYTRTFEKNWTIKAFTSDYAFDEFINKMFSSLLASDELDEFEKVKDVLTKTLSEITYNGNKVTVKSTEIDVTQDDYILTFNKELIKRSNLFSVPSRTRFENAIGVPNATPISEQYLIVSAEFSSELDSMLANAFNMDKATVLANKIIVDEFPTFTGEGVHNGATPLAMLISKDTLILKDKLVEMNNIYNPRTMSYNYFLHHHQLVSFSLFENAHVYYKK